MLSNLVSRVSALVPSTSPVFPYTFDVVKDLIFESNVYQLFAGKKNGTDEEVTIFAILDRKNARQNRIDAALNYFNELKRIRHPNILQYSDGIITEDKIMFVTEYVYPLQLCIDNKKSNIIEHKINESQIILCLYQISLALSFVHNELNMHHCLVLPSSIFITKGGDFVLGGFELAHTHKNIPKHWSTNFDLLPTKYRPKELSVNNDSIINIFLDSKNSINFLDSWCIGCLIFELFNTISNKTFIKPQQLSNLSLIPYNLQSFYKRLLATKPSSRITLVSFLKCNFIQQNSLVQTDKFLTEITIKSDDEKTQFLKYLNENIETYPQITCKYKILPILKHLLSHGFSNNPMILSLVIKIGLERESDINIIIQLFDNNERSTRINLLKELPNYISHINSQIINTKIWPKLQNGFSDSSPILREQSVRSIIHFAPKLDSDIISKELLPLLDKLQSNDIEPAIRTNTIIVLGKIAKYCITNVTTPNNKQNELLLVNCFTRALNDKFLPARNAALLSFASTISLFNPNIIANKVLPIIIKYTMDPYLAVRDSSFKCIQIGLQKLKQHSLTLSDKSQLDKSQSNTPININNTPKNNIPNNIFTNTNANTNSNTHTNDEKKENYNNKQQSLDDFLASFDLNETNKQTTTKVKHKSNSKSKSMKKSKSKSKSIKKPKVKTKEKEEDIDDFFDDW